MMSSIGIPPRIAFFLPREREKTMEIMDFDMPSSHYNFLFHTYGLQFYIGRTWGNLEGLYEKIVESNHFCEIGPCK